MRTSVAAIGLTAAGTLTLAVAGAGVAAASPAHAPAFPDQGHWGDGAPAPWHHPDVPGPADGWAAHMPDGTSDQAPPPAPTAVQPGTPMTPTPTPMPVPGTPAVPGNAPAPGPTPTGVPPADPAPAPVITPVIPGPSTPVPDGDDPTGTGTWQAVAGRFPTSAGAQQRLAALSADGIAGFAVTTHTTRRGATVDDVSDSFGTYRAAQAEARVVRAKGFAAWVQRR